MRLFLDTEFNEHNGELISMALVGKNREFYEVVEFFDRPGPWVKDNVIPVLNKPAIPRSEFQKILAIFLRQFDEVEIIADWPADVMYFCEVLITAPGQALKTPPLTFRIIDCKYESEVPHNALWDARAIMGVYESLS